MLELVVELGAVEGAGAEVLVADAGLPGEVAAPEIMCAAPEGLDGAEVAVQSAGGVPAVAVTALITGRNAVETAPVPDFGRCRGAQGPEGTAFHAGGHRVFRSLSRDDVDGAQQGRRSIDPCGRSFQDLDALDVAEVHRKVERVVSRLRVGDVDPVQEDGDLVVSAAADADVRLHAHGAALAHVHAQGVFEQVVDRLGRGRGDGHAVQEGDDAGGTMQGHGHAGRRDGDAVDGFGAGLGGSGPG